MLTVILCLSTTDILPYYATIDLSQCINVRAVHVGAFDFNHISEARDKMSFMMSAMWNSLSTLPSRSPAVEEFMFVLTFMVTELEFKSLAWLDFVGRLQGMFPNLKKIVVGVEYGDKDSLVTALRRAPGILELEQKGTVPLRVVAIDSWTSVRPLFKQSEPLTPICYPTGSSRVQRALSWSSRL